MLTKKNIQGEVYTKLMEYCFQKCDVISVTEYHDQQEEKRKKKINAILTAENCSKDDIIRRYSNSYLEELYDRLIDNEVLFDEKYRNNCEKEKFSKRTRRGVIWSNIAQIVYDHKVDDWTKRYKNNIFQKKTDYGSRIRPNEKVPYTTTYYMELTDELKEEIVSKNSLWEWCFPDSVEDLCFFKDGYCWLNSISHEEWCFIACESEEEYNYLRSLGVEFVKDAFEPTTEKERAYRKCGV